MDVRELTPTEWPGFFDAVSRQYRGRPVTLALLPPGPGGLASASKALRSSHDRDRWADSQPRAAPPTS